jgi:ribulose-5-phosphate 4-epimerase/fuculose-1-phosphate aldolase
MDDNARTTDNIPSVTDAIFQRLRRVGTAIGRVNGNNTHSGNLSIRDTHDPDLFYVTATGSQCGLRIERDIVPVRFSEVTWGDARGSTESAIHRSILSLPGVSAAIHTHYLNAAFLSFDTKEKPLFLQYLGMDAKGHDEYLFHPVDLYGAFAVGGVMFGSYFQSVGSAEMEERIPHYLTKNLATVVARHGPFVRGTSPEAALASLSILDHSASLAMHLRRHGVDVVGLQKEILRRGVEDFFPARPSLRSEERPTVCESTDRTILEDFQSRLIFNDDNAIGAYGTGSMSQKISAREMIYAPSSAIPENFPFSLYRVTLDFAGNDTIDIRMHKLIYQHTNQNACMITTSPRATAEGMTILAQEYGAGVLLGEQIDIPYELKNHPALLPIDAEAIYLNPKLGLVDMTQLTNFTATNPIFNMLRWHKGCCVVAGYGVISTGQTTLEQAAHNASSAERIAQFRTEAFLNERILGCPTVESFEPR